MSLCNGKMEFNGEAGYFCGVEFHQFLIKEKDSNEIYKASKRRCKTMERRYCKPISSTPQAGGFDLIQPHALPSVLSARKPEERKEWQYEGSWGSCYQNFVNSTLSEIMS